MHDVPHPLEPLLSSSPHVTLLGTGTMGAGMARNIAAAGIPLTVWNRSPEKAQALADVARVAESVPDAVSGADLVLTMLYDTDAVMRTAELGEGHYAADAVWVQHSTIGAEGADWVGDCAAQLGLPLVDAPVLGTKQPAVDGDLVVLASGPHELQERVQPVFDAIGKRTLWVAEWAGAGSRLKLAVNAWLTTVVEGTADSLQLTRELGLDPALFLDAVSGSAVDSPYVQTKGKAMLAGDFEPSFTLSGALKDVDLVLAAALEAHVDLAALPGVREHFARAIDAGHGDEDMSATYRAH